MSEVTEKVTLRNNNGLYICTFDSKEYGFRRLSWGERNRITSSCTRISPQGTQYLDFAEFNFQLLLSSLKKAPFDVKREVIENYPDPVLIDKLSQISLKLNNAGIIELQNL